MGVGFAEGQYTSYFQNYSTDVDPDLLVCVALGIEVAISTRAGLLGAKFTGDVVPYQVRTG